MSLKAKVEQAIAAVLADAGITADVFLGFDSDEQTRPCVACIGTQGEEDPLDTGNYWFTCRALVKSNADRQDAEDPAAIHAALAADVDEALNVDDLAELLSDATDDFHCLGVRARRWEPDTNGRSFTEAFVFEAAVVNQDLA